MSARLSALYPILTCAHAAQCKILRPLKASAAHTCSRAAHRCAVWHPDASRIPRPLHHSPAGSTAAAAPPHCNNMSSTSHQPRKLICTASLQWQILRWASCIAVDQAAQIVACHPTDRMMNHIFWLVEQKKCHRI